MAITNNLPSPSDTWTNTDVLLWKLLNGQKAVNNEVLTLSTDNAVGLASVPANVSKAIIYINADATFTDKTEVIRFLETGTNPTVSIGIGLPDKAYYEIVGADNIANFKVIRKEAKNVVINVQYFSY